VGIDLGIFADLDVSVEEVDAEPLGDQSRAFRAQVKVSLPGDDQSFTLDVAAVRVGRVVGVVTYAGFGDHNAAEEKSFGDKIVANMTAADGRLAVAPDTTSGS
jgi:hypothetical protein